MADGIEEYNAEDLKTLYYIDHAKNDNSSFNDYYKVETAESGNDKGKKVVHYVDEKINSAWLKKRFTGKSSFLDTINYFDMTTPFSPKIELSFLSGLSNETSLWTDINRKGIIRASDGRIEDHYIPNVNNDFIKSLQTSDNGGSMQATIVLHDSLQDGVHSANVRKILETAISLSQAFVSQNGDTYTSKVTSKDITEGSSSSKLSDSSQKTLMDNVRNEMVSLESQIATLATEIGSAKTETLKKDLENKQASLEAQKDALASTVESWTNPNNNQYIDLASGKLREVMRPNIRIRFGYSDTNQSIAESSWINIDQSKERYTNEKNSDRNARYWEYQNMISMHNGIKGTSLDSGGTFDSSDQETLISPAFDMWINGYKTTITDSGIDFEIKCMTTGSSYLNAFKIVQRFMEVRDTAPDLFHFMVHFFNQKNDASSSIISNPEASAPNGSYNISKSGVKIFWVDKGIPDVQNIYTISYDSDGKVIRKNGTPVIQKKIIALNFGGKDAKHNGIWDGTKYTNPKKYKSIAEIFTEFCSQVPPILLDSLGEPKKLPDGSGYATDLYDGTDPEKANSAAEPDLKTSDDGLTSVLKTTGSAPLQWSVIGYNDATKETYVGFYYKRPKIYQYIRRYKYGTGIIGLTPVTSLSIETTGEYANLLSSQSLYSKGEGIKEKLLFKSKNAGIQTNIYLNSDASNSITVNNVETNSSTTYNTKYAYWNCTNSGTMTILGDPSLNFGSIEAFSYPIFIEIILSNGASIAYKDNDDKKTVSGVITNDSLQWMSSGFYVIKNISHSITESGYTTTLEIMNYPGLCNNYKFGES